MKKTIALLLALLMCIGLLAGCAKEETPDQPDQPSAGGETNPEPEKKPEPEAKPEPDKPAEPKILKLLRAGEDNLLNVHDSNNSVNAELLQYLATNLYNTLPTEDGNAGIDTPTYAAELPIQHEDKLTWTIKLRPEAVWPDGQKITADDWIYSWKMSMDPLLMYSTGASFAKGAAVEFENAYAYYKSDSEKTDVKWEDVGIKKIDDYTIEVKTVRQVTQSNLFSHLTARTASLVRQDLYEKCMSADRRSCDYGTEQDKVMFCGPFILESWTKGSECWMVKNPTYLFADKIKVDKLYTRVVSDESTRLELYEQGECHYVTLGTNGFNKYCEDPRLRISTSKAINTLEPNMNNPKKPYLQDPNFRKALFYATDRNAIAKLTYMIPAPYFLSTEGRSLDDGTMYRQLPGAKALVPENGGYNPELAKEYMKKAVDAAGVDHFEIAITYNEGEDSRRAASEYLQSDWGKIFDGKVKVELRAMNKSAMLKMMRTSNNGPVDTWDLAWSGWSIGYEGSNPWRKAYCYSADYKNRYTPYKNTKLDELCRLAQLDEYRLDDEKMADLTVQIEQTMYDDMTCIPVMQKLSYSMFAENAIPAVNHYVTGLGWAIMYTDLK